MCETKIGRVSRGMRLGNCGMVKMWVRKLAMKGQSPATTVDRQIEGLWKGVRAARSAQISLSLFLAVRESIGDE